MRAAKFRLGQMSQLLNHKTNTRGYTMSTLLQDGDQFIVASKLKPENSYGQNGFQGASSDLPGQKTTSGFLPETKLPASNLQMRKVSAAPIAVHPGRSAPKSAET